MLPCKLPRDAQNNARNGSSNTSGVRITEKCSSRKTVLGALFVIQFIILEGYFLNFRQFSIAMIELNLSVFFCRFFFS